MTTETLEILKEAGIDPAEGIKNCVGKEALFLRLLRKFAGQDDFQQFLNAAGAGDPEAADRPLHTVKGVAANLGMQKLLGKAQAVLNKMRDSKEVPTEDIPGLTATYDEVINAIGRLPE